MPPPSRTAAPARAPGAPAGAVAALSVLFLLGAVALLIAVVMSIVHPTAIEGLHASQRQKAETGVYLAALLVALPGSVLAAPRVAARVAAGVGATALEGLTAALAAGLAVAVLLVRASGHFSWGGGMSAALAGIGLWAALAGTALWRAARPGGWAAAARPVAITRKWWPAAAALWVLALLAVTRPHSLSVAALLLGAAAAGAVALGVRRGLALPSAGRRAGWAVDVLMLAAIGLLVPDLVVVRPEDPSLSQFGHYVATIMQFHQDFILGPANQMLGGSPMLVDTGSQYGVGSVYLVAGWFKVLGVGYGTFALLDGVLTAGAVAAGYAILRLARTPRAIAGAAIAVAIVALVYNRIFPVGSLPQEGPLRFGLPMLVVLAATAASRRPSWSRGARATMLVTLAVSSVWALEAFAYTAFTLAAIVALHAWEAPAGQRRRLLARWVLLAGAACVAAHVLFALGTLAGTGHLPRWSQYLAFLHVFLVGKLGELTYDFSRWSPGLAIGAGYLAAAAALLGALRTRVDLLRAEPAATTALVGTTAYGLVLFAYFVDRSADQVAVYVSLPLVLIAALWLGLLLRPGVAPGASRAALVGLAVAAATVPVAVGWSSIRSRFDQSPVGLALPGGDSPRAAVARLRAFPAVNPVAPAGAALLKRAMPGERRSWVLADAELETELLFRAGRSNRFPIAAPREDDFVPAQRKPQLGDAVRSMRPGDRMLLDGAMLAALARARRHPDGPGGLPDVKTPLRLQAWALLAIDRRFRLTPVARGPGLVVVSLARR